jgi:hypothetical protein
LTEEANFDGLANFDPLSLLDEYLPGVLAAVTAIKTGNTVLFGVVAFLERLECGHQVVPTRNTVSDNSLCDTRSHGTLYNRSDRVHGSDNLGLILRRYVQLDLLKEILRGAESTDDEHILQLH